MNNPLGLLQALQNPQAFMQNIMSNNQLMQNPMARNAVEMYRKGDTTGLKNMAENLCRERGTTPQEVQNMVMGHLGMQ